MKFIVRMNQAERESIFMGTSPKATGPERLISKIVPDIAFTATKLLRIAVIIVPVTVMIPFHFESVKRMATTDKATYNIMVLISAISLIPSR